ncbi:MAG: hypothetical protein OK439_04835 [Thaumarchaeota archaeon]|nr:hypothetical protein [Nitrososphaerota archaeon]
MVSDNDMSMDESSTDDEMEAGEGEKEKMDTGMGAASEGSSQGESGMESPSSAGKSKSKSGGRRAALRILRENVDSVSKDLSSFRKNHEVQNKRLEKQVSSLHNEVTSLKSFISKENARARSKEEAYRNRILSRLNTPKAKVSGAVSKAKKKIASKKKSKK